MCPNAFLTGGKRGSALNRNPSIFAGREMSDQSAFRMIIVAFDGSADSVKAMGIACSLAGKYGSELAVVHVFTSPAMGFSAASGLPIPDYKALEEAKKAAGKEVLSKGLELASRSGIKPRGELIEAPSVVEALVEFAAGEKADLIVTGTRGMTGFKKLVLGSVSSGLVNHAHCPVLIVR